MKPENPDISDQTDVSDQPDGNDRFDSDGTDNSRALDVDQILEEAADNSREGSNSVESQLAEAKREVLRTRAEMENFRKRLQRESEQQLKYANVPLVRDLLEVIDNLHRAITAAGEDESKVEALRDGVVMVNKQLLSVLEKYACKPIEALGKPFDPHVHEALAQAPSEDFEQGEVMQEVTQGYLLHDRVVRPSTVIVSTGSGQST